MTRERNKSDTAFVMGVYYRLHGQAGDTDEAFYPLDSQLFKEAC